MPNQLSLWALLLSALAITSTNAVAAASKRHPTDCTGVNGIKPDCSSPESVYTRDVFWVGGQYVAGIVGLLTYDQVYVEKLTPVKGVKKNSYPIVLFHGGGVSGAVSIH